MRLSLDIEVSAYIHDHHFEGKSVLPAVEALIVLATAVHDHFPNADLRCLNNARFPRFLVIPDKAGQLPVLINLDQSPDGIISASLMTSVRSKTGSIGRNLEHARVEFSLSTPNSLPRPSFPVPDISDAPAVIIPEGSVYPGLIPFGKGFQNIIGPVSLWPGEGSALLSGGDEGPGNNPLGSPFPLDAAFHIACVWGQRFSGQVVFPIGFEKRVIHQKTKKGRLYLGRIFARGRNQNALLFDALILDSQGNISEEIKGLQMQDVSQGRLLPPVWIKDLKPA